MILIVQRFFISSIVLLSVNSAFTQDLEPRILSPVPIGVNFAVASYGYSSGNILIDNTIPIEDLDAKFNNFVFAYLHTFKLFNKLAKFDVVIPLATGNFNALVNNEEASTSRAGLADPSARLSLMLVGNKPLSPKDFFAEKRSKFNLGTQFKIKFPIGKYDETKLLNLGANRWSFKFGLASSYVFSEKLIIEGQFNTWFFGRNDDFFNGNTTEQKPLISSQIHLVYILNSKIWIALSGGKSSLGETILNDIEKNDDQNNSRYGLVIAHKINKSALKVGFTSGLSTRYGSNFTTFLLAYQFMWMNKN